MARCKGVPYAASLARMEEPQCLEELVGQNIRVLRLAKGLTLEALAKRAGLTRPNLSQLERGVHGLSMRQLYNLCIVLGCAPHEMLPTVAEARRIEGIEGVDDGEQ